MLARAREVYAGRFSLQPASGGGDEEGSAIRLLPLVPPVESEDPPSGDDAATAAAAVYRAHPAFPTDERVLAKNPLRTRATLAGNRISARVNKNSEEEFANTMTTLKSNPSLAGKLHRAMVKELYDGMCADLDDVLAEGSLSSGLAKVAKLVREASNRPDQIAWRPPGDVREHLRSLDAAIIREESEKLEQQVLKMEAENERLMKEVADRRSRIRLIEEKVNRASRACAGAVPRAEKTIKLLRGMAQSLDDLDGAGAGEAMKSRPFE